MSVRDTSKIAYKEINENNTAGKQSEVIFNVIKDPFSIYLENWLIFQEDIQLMYIITYKCYK